MSNPVFTMIWPPCNISFHLYRFALALFPALDERAVVGLRLEDLKVGFRGAQKLQPVKPTLGSIDFHLFPWAISRAGCRYPDAPCGALLPPTIEGKADQGRRDAQLQFEGGDGWNALVPESQQELETARIWEGWSPLSLDRELPVAIHFEPLAEELFEPLLAAREVCAR